MVYKMYVLSNFTALIYLLPKTFELFDIPIFYELSWWRLFQIRVVCTKLDIYVFIMIGRLLISIYIIDDSRSVHTAIISMTIYLIYWTLTFTPCNTLGSTRGTETDYPSEAFAFTSDFYGVPCCLYLVFCAVYNYPADLLPVSHQSVVKALQNLIERLWYHRVSNFSNMP